MFCAEALAASLASSSSSTSASRQANTHVFFLPPFFPLEMRLFLPTAIVARAGMAEHLHSLSQINAQTDAVSRRQTPAAQSHIFRFVAC